MKYLSIILLLWLCGCKDGSLTTQERIRIEDTTHSPVLDSLSKAVKSLKVARVYRDSVQNVLDSALLLFNKMVECKSKRDEYEIKYLRTEDDKYRRIGNRYVDSVHYYYKLQVRLTHAK